MTPATYRPDRSRIIRRTIAVAFAIAAAAGVILGTRTALDRVSEDQTVVTEEPETNVSTADVRDLTASYEATGTLQYDAPIDIAAPISGSVLRVAEPGDSLSGGDVIAIVDELAVVWLDGDVPAWRDLATGAQGVDVLQLETALTGLGFNGENDVTVDEDYTDATAAMVADWQASLDVDETGRVDIGTIVFGGARTRVASVPVAIGDSVESGATLIALGTDRRVAVLTASPTDAVTLAIGDDATVGLPDRTEITGTIAAIEPARDSWSVTVAFGVGDEFPAADLTTVDMSWTRIEAADALTIPSSALLRHDDGTYTVDTVTDDGATNRTAVTIGETIGTRTEITAGLAPGADVITL